MLLRLSPEKTKEAIDAALVHIAQNPGVKPQQLRKHLATFLGGSTQAWVNATEIGFIDRVKRARLASNALNEINIAISKDKQLFRDNAGHMDDPWDTRGDPARIAALAVRIEIITKTVGAGPW